MYISRDEGDSFLHCEEEGGEEAGEEAGEEEGEAGE